MSCPKVDLKYLNFKPEWESEYLFTINANAQAQCLVCGKIITHIKKFNIERHYKLSHEKHYKSCDSKARFQIVTELKSKLFAEIPKLNTSNEQKQCLAASYAVAVLIARENKCFNDGNIIKNGAIEMAKAFNFDIAAECFKSVPLSRQTISVRVTAIGEQVEAKLKNLLATCRYYSLCLYVSTDNSDVSKLLLCVRFIQNDFSIYEELLALIPLYDSITSIDIYNLIYKQISTSFGGFDKCSAIVTDGALTITEDNISLKELLKENGIICPVFNCIVHEEALCGTMAQFSETMNIIVEVTNMIREAVKLPSHNLKIFFDELDARYDDLVYNDKIRSLSAGKTLQRFFALRNDIQIFLINQDGGSSEIAAKFSNPDFLRKLAFLTDLTNHLNILNLKLQKQDQTISQLVSYIDSFRKKIELFMTEISKSEFHNFLSVEEINNELGDSVLSINSHLSILLCIADEFEARFKDFEIIKHELELFNNPMQVDISIQKPEYRLELCDLQADHFLISRKEIGLDFFKLLSNDIYPKLRDFGLQIGSIFPSSYSCKSTLSTVKHIKSLQRSSLADTSVSHLIRIATTKIDIDIPSLVENAMHPQCSH